MHRDASPNTPDATHPLPSEELEENLLYAVLSYRGELATWNWAFFVPNPAFKPIGTSGTLFHVVEGESSSASPSPAAASSVVTAGGLGGGVGVVGGSAIGVGVGSGVGVGGAPMVNGVNGVTSGIQQGGWRFEKEVAGVIGSPSVVAIIRLADVGFLGSYDDIVGEDSLMPMFRTVSLPVPKPQGEPGGSGGGGGGQEFSSRVWFLDAICVLHDCGVVTCDDCWLLEREIRRCAFSAMDKFLDGKGWTAYRSEHCS